MDFLPDDDPKWSQLKGGYKVLYNPLDVLKSLAKAPQDRAAWQALWLHLHHQGDVGDAAYVAVTYLILLRKDGVVFDWNFYALLATVEVQRHKNGNPPVPDWLKSTYLGAWSMITAFCFDDISKLADGEVLKVYLAVIALAKCQTDLGDMLLNIDIEQIADFIAGEMGWE